MSSTCHSEFYRVREKKCPEGYNLWDFLYLYLFEIAISPFSLSKLSRSKMIFATDRVER